MSAIKLNQDELEALAGLPHLALRIYILGIRPYMDYTSGLAGVSRRISWQGLREAGYVEPHQGLQDSGTPSRMQARRAVEWLIRSGLLMDRSEGRRLVFYCTLAHTDSSAREKPNLNPTTTRQTHADRQPDIAEAAHRGASPEKPNQYPNLNPTDPETQKPDTHPVSGNPEGHSHTPRHPQAGETARARAAEVSEILPQGPEPEWVDDAPDPMTGNATTGNRWLFERFWRSYPRKIRKEAAQRIFQAQGLGQLLDTILRDIERRQSEDRRWVEGYIPNPDNYLRDRRWEEPIEPVRGGGQLRRTGFEGENYRDEAEKFAQAGFTTDPDW